jgi:hypothetical protein
MAGSSMPGILGKFSVQRFSADTECFCGLLSIIVKKMQHFHDMISLDRLKGQSDLVVFRYGNQLAG